MAFEGLRTRGRMSWGSGVRRPGVLLSGLPPPPGGGGVVCLGVGASYG